MVWEKKGGQGGHSERREGPNRREGSSDKLEKSYKGGALIREGSSKNDKNFTREGVLIEGRGSSGDKWNWQILHEFSLKNPFSLINIPHDLIVLHNFYKKTIFTLNIHDFTLISINNTQDDTRKSYKGGA